MNVQQALLKFLIKGQAMNRTIIGSIRRNLEKNHLQPIHINIYFNGRIKNLEICLHL